MTQPQSIWRKAVKLHKAGYKRHARILAQLASEADTIRDEAG